MGMNEWIAAGADCLTPRVILIGRNEVMVEGHTGLFSYENARIRVRTPLGILTIAGEELVIAFFGAQDLSIRGQVKQILLDGEG